MKETGFLVVGSGGMAEQHARTLGKVNGAKLVGFFSGSKDRVKEISKKFNVKAFSDLNTALKDENVNALIIVSKNFEHCDQALKAVKTGKHVLIEKPVDISLKKVELLLKEVKKRKVVAGVVSQYRFSPAIKKMKDFVGEKDFGKNCLALVRDNVFRDQEYFDKGNWRKHKKFTGGGILIHHAIHFLDVLIFLLGRVKSVQAFSETLTHKIEVEDNIVVNLKFENGVIASLMASSSVKNSRENVIEIIGENKSIVFDGRDLHVFDKASKGKSFFGYSFSKPKKLSMKNFSIRDQLQDFVDCINENKQPFVTLENGYYTLKVILAAYKSAETGKVEII
ncbi:MAG: Gfo/Idh/MocA family oxidoreductase [archaeon]